MDNRLAILYVIGDLIFTKILFEYNLVLNNRKWSKIFLEETHIIKTKISLGGLFVFYKEYSVFGYQYVFKFFNFKFVIHKVNYT